MSFSVGAVSSEDDINHKASLCGKTLPSILTQLKDIDRKLAATRGEIK